jgi:hypothetical protein
VDGFNGISPRANRRSLHPFREVGREYLLTQEARAKRGEISAARPKKVRAIIEGPLDRYVGSTQVHLIGDELWGGSPAWRRENGAGRHKRNGVREVSDEMAQVFADMEAERRTKVQQTLGIRVLRPIEVKPSAERVLGAMAAEHRLSEVDGIPVIDAIGTPILFAEFVVALKRRTGVAQSLTAYPPPSDAARLVISESFIKP